MRENDRKSPDNRRWKKERIGLDLSFALAYQSIHLLKALRPTDE